MSSHTVSYQGLWAPAWQLAAYNGGVTSVSSVCSELGMLAEMVVGVTLECN